MGRDGNQSFCIYRCGEGWQSVILYLQMWGGVIISHSVFTARTHTPVCSQIVVFIAKTDVLKLPLFLFFFFSFPKALKTPPPWICFSDPNGTLAHLLTFARYSKSTFIALFLHGSRQGLTRTRSFHSHHLSLSRLKMTTWDLMSSDVCPSVSRSPLD